MKPRVYVFDFDGTLTRRDSLLAFIKFSKGRWRLLAALLHFSPQLVLMRLGLYSNNRAKQRLFSYLYKGEDIEAFNRSCRDFARACGETLLRPQGRAAVETALACGCRVFIVSASIDNWVRPFFGENRLLTVLGTQIEVANGKVTGRFLTPNCYGAEKVRRLEAALPRREDYYLTAYGDSRGDREMLNYADEEHYKPFR